MIKKEYKPADFLKAMADMKKMLLETHEIKQVKNGYKYAGEEITHHSILGGSFNIKQSVSPKMVKYEREEQGRDFLDIILCKVFQLGYQNAKIEEENDPAKQLFYKIASRQLENL